MSDSSSLTSGLDELDDGRVRIQGFVDELAKITPLKWPHCLRCGSPLAEAGMRGFCDDCRADIWEKAQSWGEEGVDKRVMEEMRKFGYYDKD